MPDATPTWTPEDAATLKALLDRYIDARTEGLELDERGPELAKADLKGQHEVSANVSWSLELFRKLDRSADTSLRSFDWKLSSRVDEVRNDIDRETNFLELEVFTTKMRVYGKYGGILKTLSALERTLRSSDRGR